MSGPAFARRYWNTLTGATASPGRSAIVRRRVGFSFWERYWASFIGADLPARRSEGAAEHVTHPFDLAPDTQRLPPVGQHGTGWFSLPALPALVGLRAADSKGVISEVATPDERTEFFIRRSDVDAAQFRIEVVLRDFDALPSVVSIRYGTVQGEQLLLVPLVGQVIGPPAAQVALPGFDGQAPWLASDPVPVDAAAAWDKDIVVASINAAVNQATRDAWREVGSLVAGELRRAIDRALR